MKWRTAWWYTLAFWQKYRQQILFGVGLGVLTVWLFPRVLALLPQQRENIYIGRVGLYSWVDLPMDIQEKMSAGLTSLNESGEPVATLAERWSVEEGGKVFRFLLKPDLRWQDGRLLKSEDIQYNFSDVQVVRTDNEIVFRLEDTYSPFPVVVAQPLFRQVQQNRFGWFRQTKIIGLGEYQVVSVQYNGPYVRELVIENDRDREFYRFYPSEQEALVAFRQGRIDRLDDLTTLDELTEREKQLFRAEEQINPEQYVAVYFNTARPNLTREVRQALNFATNKPGPNDEKLRALSPISPASWAYNASNEINTFSFDMNEAVLNYVRAEPAQPLTLILDTTATLINEAQKIADDWHALGNEVQSRCQQGRLANKEQNSNCDRYTISASVRVVRDLQDFDAVLLGREVPSDPDQYTWWHSNQPSNISQYQNPRVDKLLEDARKETDQQKRKVLYFEFQRYLVEDVPAMFLYYVSEYRLTRRNWI